MAAPRKHPLGALGAGDQDGGRSAARSGEQAALCAPPAINWGSLADTLCNRLSRAEVDAGHRLGVSSAEARRIAEVERENRVLPRANEILRTDSVFRRGGVAADMDQVACCT